MKKQTGFTLIELLVGLVVGLIVLSAVIYIFIVTLKTSKDIRNGSVLNNEVSIVADLIAGEMRRIGYDGDTSVAGTDDTIILPAVGSSGSCLKYIYDKSTVAAGLGDDLYSAFWLASGAVRYTDDLTSAAACSGGSPVTSDRVAVTNLVFTLVTVSQAGSSDLINELQFNLSAQIAADDEWSTSIDRTVQVRNNVDK